MLSLAKARIARCSKRQSDVLIPGSSQGHVWKNARSCMASAAQRSVHAVTIYLTLKPPHQHRLWSNLAGYETVDLYAAAIGTVAYWQMPGPCTRLLQPALTELQGLVGSDRDK